MGQARIGRVRMKAGGAEVVPLRVVEVGEGYRFEADKILAAAMGQGLTNVVIVGERPDGELWLSAAANAGVSLILIERAKARIVDPD